MRKSNLTSFQLLTNASMAANITSKATNIEFLDNIGIQVNLTGASTANGVIAPQVSLDYQQDLNGNILNAGNWIPLQQPDGTPVQVAVVAGSPSNSFLNLDQLSAPFIRLVYTAASGTGTLNAFVGAKMI